MGTFLQDVRFAARRLRTDAGFALGVLTMLALGLAASIAMFSILRGVVLSAMPYPDAERVMSVYAANSQQEVADGRLTRAEAVALSHSPSPFEAFGYYTWNGVTVFEEGVPREITVNLVSAGFFPALGMLPLHGRWIEEADAKGNTPAIVLSYTEWQRLFGGDPAAIGRYIDADGGRLEVVGVMPPEFGFPWTEIGGWRPYAAADLDAAKPGYWQARFLAGVGRLSPGVGTAQAAERLAQVGAGVRESFGLPEAGWRFDTRVVLEELVASVRPVLWGAFAIALLVLLIACVNSAILLDARLVRRMRELAISQALGAGIARLRRILAIELGLLAIAAAGASVLLVAIVLDRFRVFAAERLPRVESIALDGSVVAFALAAGGLAIGLILLQGWRIGALPVEALRRAGTGLGSRGATSRRRILPAAGIALSTIAVACAVALALSLIAMQSVSPGFRTDCVYVLQMFRGTAPAQWGPYAEQALERLRALPGVERATISTAMPMSGIGTYLADVTVPGSESGLPTQASLRRVGAGYLELLEVPLVEGRAIAESDGAGGEPVAVLSRTLARRLFGTAPALDRTVLLPRRSGAPTAHRVVGVMEDTRNESIRAASQPELLVPYAQEPWVGMSFLVRGETLDATVLGAMQSALWEIDPRQAFTRVYALEEDLDAQLAPSRFFVAAIGAFALVSVLLGTLGVYAVTAFVQRERTPEYGLKLAIGAQPRAMAVELLGETLRVAAIGLVVGLAGAWLALRLLSEQLFSIGASDLAAYAIAVATMAASAVIAGAGPALRAAHVDPMRALRNE